MTAIFDQMTYAIKVHHQIVSCPLCLNGDFGLAVQSCEHRYCAPCLKAEFNLRLTGRKPANFACPVPGCAREQMYPRTLRQVLTEQELAQLESLQMAVCW